MTEEQLNKFNALLQGFNALDKRAAEKLPLIDVLLEKSVKEAEERLALEARIKVLEDVRQKQRELNSTFVQKDKVEVRVESKKSRFKFW